MNEHSSAGQPSADLPTAGKGILIIAAALLALFLGALDALVMTAAMPTIVADLGGMELYSWVYSAYFLARAVSLPIFGKLADLFQTKQVFISSILIFMLSSAVAGACFSMPVLIAARIFQGIGAGGIFALVYTILSKVSTPEKRGKVLSVASAVWGIASVVGPTMGGVIVSYFSWRWIFFINIPIGLFSIAGIALFLVEMRLPRVRIHLDLAGAATLSTAILSVLMIFLLGGRNLEWLSLPMAALVILGLVSGIAFFWVEKRASEPILALDFFTVPSFSLGNGAVFLSSFAIFALFAYAPLYIQGALEMLPMQVGLAMLSLSLGWSLGSLFLGQMINRLGKKPAAVTGALVLVAGCAGTFSFSTATTMAHLFTVFFIVGIGMGFISLVTLIIVQSSLASSDLGVATSTHQFARTLGGTVGVGICGGITTNGIFSAVEGLSRSGPAALFPHGFVEKLRRSTEVLFQPEVKATLSNELNAMLQQAVGDAVGTVFLVVTGAALMCTICCLLLPARGRGTR
jgi:EmrB/QacA subfamily drug resistance transporter